MLRSNEMKDDSMGIGQFDINIDFKKMVDLYELLEFIFKKPEDFIRPVQCLIVCRGVEPIFILLGKFGISHYKLRYDISEESLKDKIEQTNFYRENSYVDLDELIHILRSVEKFEITNFEIFPAINLFYPNGNRNERSWIFAEKLHFTNGIVNVPVANIRIWIKNGMSDHIGLHTYSRLWLEKTRWDEEKDEWVEGNNIKAANLNIERLANKLKLICDEFGDSLESISLEAEHSPHIREYYRLESKLIKLPKFKICEEIIKTFDMSEKDKEDAINKIKIERERSGY